ncbi:glycosyltransferase family 2 protein [Halorubrum ezzemoulense]|uniref:glycosyltransferase family 2 protein n=1 Tax=Halorubrum ezzemoulense TaxID=337243 RepID=UPI0023301E11|nr:glycosyltransferase family 2 protein [Halorubrum ezzemoulense]MDB2248605.1 glycosyltransferase family 2 protein [Halorubrum ezzemoulense]MDB2276122.1 glycosyltransferase family 2 protein [Halorubrum ezzemoulense]
MNVDFKLTKNLKKDPSQCPKVGIIVINWNNYEDTAECLNSISNISYPDFDVILVDNGSRDGSREQLQEEFGWCKFVFNNENLGFAKGVNSGMKSRLERYDYFLLLNNDAIVQPGLLNQLVVTGEEQGDIGIVGAKLQYDESTIHSAGREFKSFDNIYEGKDPNEVNGIYEVGGVIGACMLIKVDMILDIGMLDEDFFFGGEDEEYSLRAIENDWKIVVQGDASVLHKSGATADRDDFIKYHSTKNQMKLRLKRDSFSAFDIIKKASRDMKIFFGYIALGRFSESKAILIGYYDLLIGKKEKRTDML